MKIESPFLNIDKVATNELIDSSISSIKGQQDAFVILSQTEMDYIQALASNNGYIVQFQVGTVKEHYEFDTYLSSPQTIKLFQSYFSKEPSWQGSISFTKVSITDFWGTLGYRIGYFFGRILRFLKIGR